MTRRAGDAMYHPVASKTSGDWIKTMLLFFDRVVLVQRSVTDDLRCILELPAASNLLEQEVLDVLDVGALTDAPMVEAMRNALTDTLTCRALESVGRDELFYYGQRIYWTLNGPEPSIDMMDVRNELMQQIGAGAPVREPGAESPKVPVQARIWAPVLSTAPQTLRSAGLRQGLDLHPVTDRSLSVTALARVLELVGMPTRGGAVAFELEQVALDLRDAPVDEILAFRDEHGERYREYARELRRHVSEVSTLEGEERETSILERRQQLAEVADELRGVARRWWRRPFATFGLGIVGAAWEPATDGVPLTSLARIVGVSENGSAAAESYSYVFSTQPQLYGAPDRAAGI